MASIATIPVFRRLLGQPNNALRRADWEGEVKARKDRIDFYDQRVNETVEYVDETFSIENLDRSFLARNQAPVYVVAIRA